MPHPIICKLLLFLFLFPFISYANSGLEQRPVDTFSYTTYTDAETVVSFNYPAAWENMYYSGSAINFRATEKLIQPNDHYKENLAFIKMWYQGSLNVFMKNRFKGLKAHTRHKIELLKKEVSTNKNGVTCQLLLISSKEQNLQLTEAHVYFKKGDFIYNFIFKYEMNDADRYNIILSDMIQSVSF